MSEIVDYNQLVAFLKEASLHEIYRVSVALDNTLEDPERIAAVSNQFKVGDNIEYYDKDTNRLVQAHVIKKKPKYVLVANCNDGARWNIPYHMLKINSRDIEFKRASGNLDKNTLHVGDWVSFYHEGKTITGRVKRLNQKTVTLVTSKQQQWRVSYRSLHTVIDGQQHTAVIEYSHINVSDE